MVSVSDVIDTSGSRPRIRPGALATLLTGTVIWGWFAGWIGYVDAALGGVTSSVEDLGYWIERDLLAAIFGIAEDGTAEIAAQNASAISSLGLLGQLIAVGQVALLVLFVAYVVRVSIGRLGGITP